MKLFKLIYNLSIFVVIILGIISLINKNYFLGVVWIILTPLLLILPRLSYNLNLIKKKFNKKIIDFFEILILILLLTSVSLTLGLKKLPIDFDSFSHFINLAIYTILIGIVYYIYNLNKNKKINSKEIVLFALITSLIFGVILWEKFQYYSDIIFHTKMYSDYFQDVKIDSLLDQIFGTLGSFLGAFILNKNLDQWIKKWKK